MKTYITVSTPAGKIAVPSKFLTLLNSWATWVVHSWWMADASLLLNLPGAFVVKS